MEAADLGVALCQSAARSVYACFAVVAVPVMALSLAASELAEWIPMLAIWWAKPWLDRTVLFVLSRAAFGQRTTPLDLWQAQRDVWWRQFFFTWTIRRMSLWRSLTQPVYQLEGLSIRNAHARVRQVRTRHAGSALLMTTAFSLAEAALTVAVVSLAFWLAPEGSMRGDGDSWLDLVFGVRPLVYSLAYAVAVLFLEPFYVAAGFAMYLNRRAELEAWDIEQELRRAFSR
jgi:hypothetical protein